MWTGKTKTKKLRPILSHGTNWCKSFKPWLDVTVVKFSRKNTALVAIYKVRLPDLNFLLYHSANDATFTNIAEVVLLDCLKVLMIFFTSLVKLDLYLSTWQGLKNWA